MTNIKIVQGDCLLSLAHKHGIAMARVMEHHDNAELMSQRHGDPSLLLPGDRVALPRRITRDEPCDTGRWHSFRRKVERAEIRIQLCELGMPRANERYQVWYGSRLLSAADATTDDQGTVICAIPPDASRVTVVVGPTKDEYTVHLGELDPFDTPSGVLGRLQNLGHHDGDLETAAEQISDDETLAAQIHRTSIPQQADIAAVADGIERAWAVVKDLYRG